MTKKYLKYIISPIFLSFFVLACANVNSPTMAADTLLSKTKTPCIKDGSCSVNDMNNVIIRVSEIILGVVGSLALLAFVAGGFMLMLSAGNKTWVDRGKATIIGAVVGLAIVFLSYTIIGFVFKSLGISDWYKSNWF